MRRPGLWLTNGHPGDPSLMLSWRPGALTSFYDYLGVNGVFEYKAAHPEVPVIIRFQHPRNWQQDPVFFAKQLGQEVASKWDNMKRLDPYVYFANEMNLFYENGDNNPGNQHLYTSPDFYKRYSQWVRMTADVVKNIVPEMKLITPPFAFGHHEDGTPDDNGNPKDGWAGYDYLYETVRDYFDNILTFHGYWGHGGGSQSDWLYHPELSSWYAFRWRRVLKLFETRYKLPAKMIIDEAGNFGASDADFTDQVIYYAHNCLQDARVLALTFFLWMDPTHSPGNMPNSWVQKTQNLTDHLTRLRNMPDIPIIEIPQLPPTTDPPEQKIRVLFDDGIVRSLPVEEYLRAVVPAEMPALWPAEAVKAQAVASRTYAQYTIENPRHPNADICTNPAHCQNFNLDKIHPNADEAIQATKGLVARYNGKTISAFFSANCGGHTRNNNDVFPGAALPYLRGIPCPDSGDKLGHGVGLCQYGARAFAQQGRSYEQIIKYYYTGVTIGEPSTQLTSTILGKVVDHTDRPVSGVKLTLTGGGQTVEMVTLDDGSYRFTNIPDGSYRLELPAYSIRKENIRPLPGEDLPLDITLPAPLTVEISRGAGLPLIVGNWGQPDVPILITPPQGGPFKVITGTKLEFGPGGFETYAGIPGIYTLQIENYQFKIQMSGRFTRLTFVRHAAPPPPTEPVPEKRAHLISESLPLSRAETILNSLDAATRNLFKIIEE
jgi:hypothetical protein